MACEYEWLMACSLHLGMNVVKSVVGWPILKRAAIGSHSVSGGRVVAISITVQPTDLSQSVSLSEWNREDRV